MSKMSRIKSAFAKLKHIKLRWLLLAASIVVLSLVIAFLLQGREKTPIIVSDISILLDVSEGYFNSFKFGSEIHSIKVKEVGEGYAIFEVRSDPLLVRVNIGVDERIDVNGDGVLDVYLRVSKIDGKKVTFSIVKVVEEPTSLESGRYETPSKELKPVDSKRSIVEKIKIVSRGGGGGGGGGAAPAPMSVACKSDDDAYSSGKENIKDTCEDVSGIKEDTCVEEVANPEGVGAAALLIEGFVLKITGQAIGDVFVVNSKKYKSVAASSFVLEYECADNICAPRIVRCLNGCKDGVCKQAEQLIPQMVCTAGSKICVENILKTCSEDGSSWSEENCNDNNACTADVCDSTEGCKYTPINCDDGLFCNGAEVCDPLTGCGLKLLSLSDGLDCTMDSCDEIQDLVIHTPDDSRCGDGNLCNGAEVCDVMIGCKHGVSLVVNDGVSCTTDSCDLIAGVRHIPNDALCDDNDACTIDSCDKYKGCTYTSVNCDDGLFCNGRELCDLSSGCRLGSPITISDGIACTADSCDEVQDKVIHTTNNAMCDNNNICDGVETCSLQGCRQGVSLVCEDDNYCTEDSCDAMNGCRNTQLDCELGCDINTGQCKLCPPAQEGCDSNSFGKSECTNQNHYHTCSKVAEIECYSWSPEVECEFDCNGGICASEEFESPKLIKVLVIPFTTSDVPMPSYVTQQWLSDMMFSPDAPHDSLNKPNSLRNYMEQVSYGKFTIDGEVTPIVTLPQTFDYYKNQPDTSPYNEGWMLMKKDVVEMADLIIDFKQFDGDRNGEVDMVVFLMPQGVNRPTYEDGIMQRILGVRGDSAGGFYYVDANGVLNNYGNDENVPMFSHIYIGLDYHPDGPFIPTFGILTHEFMHIAPVRWYGKSYSTVLSNLQSNLISDLYDMPYENVGDYELMSTGGHRKTLCATKSGFGAYSSFSTCSAPTHFSGYTKMKLGFLVPHTLLYNSDETVRLYKTEESPPYTENIKLIKLPAASNNFNDFYLLELRTNKQFESGHNFDVGLGYEFFNPGLVVYHSIDRAADAIGVGVNFVTGGPINELYVIDATPGDPEQIYAGAAFGFSTEMSYTTPEGIRIEIISMHESRDYVDVKITYPCGDGYNKVCLPEQPSACNVGWQCVDADTKVYHFADCSKGGTTDCPINCENGVCKSCTDSDSDGYNFQQSYNIQGITMGKDQSNPNSIKTATDQCETVTLLTEYFCYNNFVLKDLHTCPNGCQDGACKVSL